MPDAVIRSATSIIMGSVANLLVACLLAELGPNPQLFHEKPSEGTQKGTAIISSEM